MNTKFVVRRIGVISLAKITGVLYACIGLIIGAFVSLFAMVGSAFANAAGSQFGPFLGIGAIILFPILYGIGGFIGGLILGGLYNLVSGISGGIELEGTYMQIGYAQPGYAQPGYAPPGYQPPPSYPPAQ